MIVEIIPNLYLGNWRAAADLNLLQALDIEFIVNASQLANFYPHNFTYLTVAVEDADDAQINRYFTKVSRFVYNALLKRKKVLIHCVAASLRSPTLVIAFLIKKKKMTLEEAYKLVQTKQRIDINPGFLKQLQQLNESIHISVL